MKVLFLQQKSYFDLIGFDYTNIEPTFCCTFSINVVKYISSFDLIISCIDHDKDCRKLIHIANNIKIPTVFFMDGVFDYSNSIHNPILKKIGITLFEPFCYKNIFVVGKKFGENLEKSYQIRFFDYLPERAMLNVETNVSSKTQVLITTAITPYFSYIERQTLITWFLQIKKVLIEIDVPYSFRVFDIELYDSISDEHSINLIDNSFSDTVVKFTHVICTPSTIIHTLSNYNINNLCINFRNENLLYDTDLICTTHRDIYNSILTLIRTKPKIHKPIKKNKINLLNYDFIPTRLSSQSKTPYRINLFFSFSSLCRIFYNLFSPKYKKKIKCIFSSSFYR